MEIWSKCDICGRDIPVGELCYGLKKGNCICKNCCTGFENCTFTLAPMPTLTPPNEPLTLERMRGEWRSIHGLSEYYCSRCGEEFEIHAYDKDKYQFCPHCMAPMTDEAVQMVMERMEALKDG